MSRFGGTGETILVRPTNNIYTVLVMAAVVVEVLGLAALYLMANQRGMSLFQ